MKEASGELSMTAIAVVAIAAIGVLFYQLIWPAIQANIQRNTYCSQAFNCTCGGNDLCTCSYIDGNGNQQNNLRCPNESTAITN